MGDLSDGCCLGLPTATGVAGVHNLSEKHTRFGAQATAKRDIMNTIIYIVGLVVIIGVILSYFGLR